MIVEFVAELPLPLDKGRRLHDVQVDDIQQWHRFEAVRTMAPSFACLGDLNWKQLVKFVIGRALEKAGFAHGRYHVTAELWHLLAARAHLGSPQDICHYLQAWSISDPYVSQLLTGRRRPTRSSADLGGWLADYMNTVFRVAHHGARADAKYVVVDNALYRSVAQMTFTTFIDGAASSVSGPPSSTVALGDIWESLVWHAYENDRPEFVLGMILVTMTRAIANVPSTAASSSCNASFGSPLQPPPPPPFAPTASPAPPPPPPPPSSWSAAPPASARPCETQVHQLGQHYCLQLICREHDCQEMAFTAWCLDEHECYRQARELGWNTPSTKGWKHARCRRHAW